MSYRMDRPDGLLGSILALEGVRDATTIMHGPTGCKMYPSDLSEKLFIKRDDHIRTRNPFLIGMKYFFYQPRLPCTLLDGNRLILGAGERLADLYSIVEKEGPSMIGILNSPGASLTGEDLNKVSSDIPTVRIDSHEFSAPMQIGFSDTSVRIVETIASQRDVVKGTVNVFGLSMWHIRFQDNVDELRRILGLCGVEVNCFLCAGSSVKEIESMASAELNVVVDSDFGLKAAEYCRDRFGTPFIEVCPIGFSATEDMIVSICRMLGKDPSIAMEDLKRWRRMTSEKISTLEKRYVTMRGRSFSVHNTPCITKALSRFVYDYLGLIPVALECCESPDWFPEMDLPIEKEIWDVDSDIVFGTSSEIVSMIDRGLSSGGVEISEPSTRPVSIIARPLMGTMGSVHIMEDTLNALIRMNDRL